MYKKVQDLKLKNFFNMYEYRQDEPKSYSVVYGTDLIKDYIKDIETLLLDN